MDKEIVLHLHGFASSANSTKARFLSAKFSSMTDIEFHAINFNPTRRDFAYMTITGMINRLRQHLLDREPPAVSLIGSSMGALVGLHYVHRFGGVKRLLLLAPALTYRDMVSKGEARRWEEEGLIMVQHYAFETKIPLYYGMHIDGAQYRQPIPPTRPTLIVHGRGDDVIPIELSRRYAIADPELVVLREVDSDHRLNDRLDFIWEQARAFLVDAD